MFKTISLDTENNQYLFVDSDFQEPFMDYTLYQILPYNSVLDKAASVYKEKKYNLVLVLKWIKKYNVLDYKYAENYFKTTYPNYYNDIQKYMVLL